MSKLNHDTPYEIMYNYKYMLETGYTFDEYARTVASQIKEPNKEDNDKSSDRQE